MSKRGIRAIGLILLLILLLACSCFLYYAEPERNPRYLRYYPEEKKGFMQFDSDRILYSIERGDTDIFSQMESWHSDAEYPDIEWTQAQFLLVANALSQQVWNESLDFDQWDVFEFRFGDAYCDDHIDGFFYFELTYYKTIKTGQNTAYIARKMSIRPYEGVAVWAGDDEFYSNFLHPWHNIDITNFQITAEHAHLIAEENGAKPAHINYKYCSVFIDAESYWSRDIWLVEYASESHRFKAYIDPFSGKILLRTLRTR